jgi:alpha-L-fucosidase 2
MEIDLVLFNRLQMHKNVPLLWLVAAQVLLAMAAQAQPGKQHNLKFDSLNRRWDEAIPLGNGLIGALIWQKEDRLRISLDRADLWDQRPMNGLHRKEFSYQWVFEQVVQQDYAPVQKNFDHPYDREPAPTKIPGGALEFSTSVLGSSISAELDITRAESTVHWKSGAKLRSFVHASLPVGYFQFEHIETDFEPELVTPRYQGTVSNAGDPVGGDDLARLGYPQGIITKKPNSLLYEQEGWGGFRYRIYVTWKRKGRRGMEGVWAIETVHPDSKQKGYRSEPEKGSTPFQLADSLLKLGYVKALETHLNWWKNFWSRSMLRVPDPVIEKQWYLEQYKFGSAARENAPPISLQAVWTADNGRIPPWKGDYHHDLNTQLSYWPSYTANHLEEALGYLNHLDENKLNYQRYTKLYFGVDGLAVPGVTTLDGTEMGGWIQYSLSPTVSAWLAHHYYLQWEYGRDIQFLRSRAYPWLREVARFIESITIINEKGERHLPISSSPEINDNALSAWFRQTTNYDLALMKFAVKTAADLARELQKIEPGSTEYAAAAEHWDSIGQSFPDYAVTAEKGLQFSRTLPYKRSHRHFSHLLAIHPLGLIKWEDGEAAQQVIRQTILDLDRVGPDQWCGYSYAWLANLKAWAKDGQGAAAALKTFATAFCSINSFHLNGDQSGKGYSSFTYRPFTLEGNFAYAAGLQDMLLQSQAGYIALFPAVPDEWLDCSFQNFRARGAFLVDAKRSGGKLVSVVIRAEKDGEVRVKIGAGNWIIKQQKSCEADLSDAGWLTLRSKSGGVVELTL